MHLHKEYVGLLPEEVVDENDWFETVDEVVFTQKHKMYNWIKIKRNFMVPFHGWGSTASRLEPLRGGSLLFTTKFPEIPGTNFINLRRMND